MEIDRACAGRSNVEASWDARRSAGAPSPRGRSGYEEERRRRNEEETETPKRRRGRRCTFNPDAKSTHAEDRREMKSKR
jgi:hypothetical protein